MTGFAANPHRVARSNATAAILGQCQAFWSATRIAVAIRAGQLSAVELLESCIQRIERFDETLNAVCVRQFKEARVRARAVDEAHDRGEAWGSLHGVPVTVKEGYDVAGMQSSVEGRTAKSWWGSRF